MPRSSDRVKPSPNVVRSLTYRSLTDAQLVKLHEASLDVLNHTGVRFHAEPAVTALKRAGARVSDGNLVRIPPHLVEWALRTAPKSVNIYDRSGQRAMTLGGYRSYYGVGSDCASIYDVVTGQHRKAVIQDVVNGVRLVDALPNLDFVMSMFLPSDAPAYSYEIHQMEVMLRESRKPIVFVGLVPSSTVYALDLAAAVAGGMDALAERPFVINYVNPASAVQHNEEAVLRLMYAAERNIPTIYVPAGGRGVSTPMTRAGAMAVGNAGQLAALALAQIVREGSPFIRGGGGSGGLNMRTMTSSYAGPGGPQGWDLAHYYGLPIFGTAGCSDAKVFDAQAAAEAALSLFSNTVAGANLIHDIGYLDFAMTGSLELVAYCDELIGWLKEYVRDLELTEEELALDLIEQVGPDGSFLDTDHTLHHVRDHLWAPDLADQQSFGAWSAAGATTLQERANRKVRRILESHRQQPLSRDVMAALSALVARADTDSSFVPAAA